jgi:hypothetical protein
MAKESSEMERSSSGSMLSILGEAERAVAHDVSRTAVAAMAGIAAVGPAAFSTTLSLPCLTSDISGGNLRITGEVTVKLFIFSRSSSLIPLGDPQKALEPKAVT